MERNAILVRKAVRVLAGVDELEEVDAVDEADAELGEVAQEEVYSRERLMCADVAA